MATRAETAELSPGWLRGAGFDLGFVVGTVALAVFSGALVLAIPKLFGLVLLLDLWLLGYHHVIATYTRLCFDKASFRQNRFLVLWLPIFVFGTTLALALIFGPWILASVYLYWQWFHYTRQSWGVAQVYRRKAGGPAPANEILTKLVFYLLPLWGILYRSWQAPDTFLGMELRVIPVPEILVDIVALTAVITLAIWIESCRRAFLEKRVSLAYLLYMASHFIVFGVAYLAIEDVTIGWLVVNIWHNAQYVLFVWLYNTNRFRGGIDPLARFLSRISQSQKWPLYFAWCLAISSAIYFGITFFESSFYSMGLPSLLIIYQTINFHHYIVDAVIWKSRKPEMQKTLGLSTNRFGNGPS